MPFRCLSLILGCFTLMSAPLSAQSPPSAKPGVLTEGSATVKNDSGATSSMGFWTWLPKAEKPAAGWPLMVFLHGAGERGSDLNLVKKHGPPKLAGQQPVMDRFFMLAPQCPTGRWWDIVAVKDLIDQTLASQPVDPKRVYITGISMGGFATWAMLKDYPTLMAAAVPICGGGDPASVSRFSSVPVWAFHGDKDEAVPAQRSIDMVEALKQAKGDIRFTLYPGVTHDSWTRTFENPELYEWLLKHQRK